MLAHSQAERERIAGRACVSVVETVARLRAGGLEPGHHLLEVGCGSGIHAAAVATAVDAVEVTGLEPDFNFATEAKLRLRGRANARVRIGRAERLQFADDSFDAYYARLVYQHCTEPMAALTEACRVLRPGGRCMIDDIDRGWFMSWPEPAPVRRLWRQVEAAQVAAGGDPFVGRKLAALLRDSGFHAVRTDIRGLSTDGEGIADFVADTGESLLDMLPAAEREAGRDTLAEWAAQAAADPEAHQLCLGWFMVTGSA